MAAYPEKLRDPRWQKKRLEILQRDGWKCQICQDEDRTLVVHHKDYLPKTDPWDYPDKLLITLCEACHNEEMDGTPIIEQNLLHHLRHSFNSSDLFIIENGFEILKGMDIPDSYLLAETLRWFLTDPSIQEEMTQRCYDEMRQAIERVRKELHSSKV